eukprot:tig00020685_g12973.t1
MAAEFKVTAANLATYTTGKQVTLSYATAIGGGAVQGSPLSFDIIVSTITCTPTSLVLLVDAPVYAECTSSPSGGTPSIQVSDMDAAIGGPPESTYSNVAASGSGVSFYAYPTRAGIRPIFAPFISGGGPSVSASVTGVNNLRCTPPRAPPGQVLQCSADKGNGLPDLDPSVFSAYASTGTISSPVAAAASGGGITFSYTTAFGGASGPEVGIRYLQPGTPQDNAKAAKLFVGVVSATMSCTCNQAGLSPSECRIRMKNSFNCTVTKGASSADLIPSDITLGSLIMEDGTAYNVRIPRIAKRSPVSSVNNGNLQFSALAEDFAIYNGKAVNFTVSLLGAPLANSPLRVTVLGDVLLDCPPKIPTGSPGIFCQVLTDGSRLLPTDVVLTGPSSSRRSLLQLGLTIGSLANDGPTNLRFSVVSQATPAARWRLR